MTVSLKLLTNLGSMPAGPGNFLDGVELSILSYPLVETSLTGSKQSRSTGGLIGRLKDFLLRSFDGK